ncbi:MAG TPA: hypothetical protein VN670_04145, partial [Acidobacteriaceae bacterium]|nr:hypothetical protein [Acidobacteriaceae bacterium]
FPSRWLRVRSPSPAPDQAHRIAARMFVPLLCRNRIDAALPEAVRKRSILEFAEPSLELY